MFVGLGLSRSAYLSGAFGGTALAEAKEVQWNLRTRTTCPNKGFQALGFLTIAL